MIKSVDQLCPNCGLCCDSTLFADVELRAGDDPQRLAKLGLTIEKKGKNKLAFAQPCACFDGKLCGIYHDRPKRCRLFECGLLKRVDAGEMTPGAALKKIRSEEPTSFPSRLASMENCAAFTTTGQNAAGCSNVAC